VSVNHFGEQLKVSLFERRLGLNVEERVRGVEVVRDHDRVIDGLRSPHRQP
jgi:hypothetical protein